MINSKAIEADVCIIGAGLAGLAAALFAANRGLTGLQVGHTGEISFASGFLDLMGVTEKTVWDDPWAGIDALVREIPEHPYARLSKEDIREAFGELLAFLDEVGLPYNRLVNGNIEVLTSLGRVKTTYCVPHTMWSGVDALKKKPPCLLVDIRGLKGYSARRIADALHNSWPDLRTVRISFPDTDHLNEVYTEHMANALILSGNRKNFAQLVRPHVKGARIVGLPAVLGLYRTLEIVSDLEKLIGVPLFEIPTLPPSVPGLRLKEAFDRSLRNRGIRFLSQRQVLEVRSKSDGFFELDIGRSTTEHRLNVKSVILASGRFIGGGLHADRKRIRETIFDLPVYQPANRVEWHRRDFLDPRGHLINRAGLKVDDQFRPLDNSRQPAYQRLFAAGSILAHSDWKRLKCGAGVAIASAFGAVRSCIRTCR
jgi:glycerol-3-phosphate dehydrogenase subunit B